MPHVINGIGTWYYGSGRVHRLKASCEFCHRIGELRSYDTTLYFVFVMVPVIPLKKMRILDECPHCKRHRAANLKVWEKAKNEAVLAALAPLAETPNDREALSDALGVVAHYQDESLFNRIADFAKSETGDAKLQHQLGVCCGYFSRREEAETAFANALRVEDSPEIRKSAALNALRMGRPDRAEALVDFVLRDKVEDDAGFLSLVAESYMSHGQHEEALALMDRRDSEFPDAAAIPDLVKLRKQATKHLGTGKRLNTVNLTDSRQSGSSAGNPLGARIAKFVFPIILIALFAAYLGSAFWKGSNQRVYLVNGTDKAYRVTVNGAEHAIPANRATPIRIAEGEITVEAIDAGLVKDPVTATVRTSFWGRPFSAPVFAFNPDRSAVLVEEQTTYSATPGTNPPMTFSLGEGFYQFAEPDYAFEPFPQSMKLKSGQSITKSRVGLETGLVPFQKVAIAYQTNRNGAPPDELIKRLCLANPNESLFVNQIATLLKPDDALAFLNAGLNRRPLLVDWHRLYQTLMETHRPDADLVPEYRKLADGEKSGDARYLLARISPEGAESDRLLEEAATAKPDCHFAWYSMAYRTLARGDFPSAKSWIQRVVEAQPADLGFRQFQLDVLWANREYDAHRTAASQMTAGIPGLSLLEQFRGAAAQGDPDVQQQIRMALARQNGGRSNPLVSEKVLDGIQAMIKGDTAAYLKKTEGGDVILDDETIAQAPRFERAILKSNPDEAKAAIDTIVDKPQLGNDETAIRRGILSLFYRKEGNAAKADEQVQLLAKALLAQSRTEKRLGTMLNGSKPFDADFVLASIVHPRIKRVVLLVFADKYPEHAATFRALSAKLDYQRDVYSLCLNVINDKK